MEKQYNPEIDVTKFVNIDDKKFIFHINKQPREIEAGEEKVMPIYVAQIGAKHLVDRILQEKHNIKDTLRDTPLRQSIFAQILPDLAVEKEIKPLEEDEFKKQVELQLKKQQDFIDKMTGKEERLSELEQKIKELEQKLEEKKRLGRPPKQEQEQS